MKSFVIFILTAFLLSTNAAAAIKRDDRQARNMDDVHSLGVIYINHYFATEQEAELAINEDAEPRGARYSYPMLIREPGSNGNIHVSAEIYH